MEFVFSFTSTDCTVSCYDIPESKMESVLEMIREKNYDITDSCLDGVTFEISCPDLMHNLSNLDTDSVDEITDSDGFLDCLLDYCGESDSESDTESD